MGFEFIFAQRHETTILPFGLSRQPLSLGGSKTHPIVKRSRTRSDTKISSRGTLGYPNPVHLATERLRASEGHSPRPIPPHPRVGGPAAATIKKTFTLRVLGDQLD